jgi:Fe-S cluster assembly iron-binding protein IscA
MLTLTPTAEIAIRQIIESSPLAEGGLRISAEPGENGQAAFNLALVEGPGPLDQVVEDVAVPVYLEPQVASLLDEGVLDAAIEDERVTFTVGPRTG